MSNQEHTPLIKALEIIGAQLDEVELRVELRDLSEGERILLGKVVDRVLKLDTALKADELEVLAGMVLGSAEETEDAIDRSRSKSAADWVRKMLAQPLPPFPPIAGRDEFIDLSKSPYGSLSGDFDSPPH